MSNLLNAKCERNRVGARYLLMAVAAIALLVLPLGLPGTTTTIEAGCFTDGPTLDQMVSTVSACPSSGINVTFNVLSNFGLTGACGDAHVEFLNTDNGTGYASSNFVIHLDPSDPYTDVNFGFRIVGYPAAFSGAPKKVHDSLTVTAPVTSCVNIFP